MEVLRRHAAERPDKTAYVFLADGEVEAGRLTFAETDLRARAVAAALHEHGAVGERVLIAYPSGLDYVVALLGCLYAGMVAVPCDLPQRRPALERFQRIAADARPLVALGPAAQAESLTAVNGLGDARLLDVAQVPDEAAAGGRELSVADPEALALMQYTSGSTQAPRGVMVSHGNIMANERSIAATCQHDADSTFVGWLPLFHDMGMIANVLQALYLGSPSVLMSPLAFLAKPVRWLRAVSRYRGHTSGGPNFCYDLCALRIAPEDREGLDLSSWRVAFNGAEVVRASTMQRFFAAFAPVGFDARTFFPCYGLAEATLIVSGAPRGRPPLTLAVDPVALRGGRLAMASPDGPRRDLSTSGTAAHQTSIAIVNPKTGKECPSGVLGEIWVGGPSVARGYWERPEETAATFQARIAGSGAGPFLRTGDLGGFVSGELVVTGRIKDVIVIRGQNYYPHDLEWAAETSHPGLRPTCGAAFAIDADDEERLVIVYEVGRPAEVDTEEVARAVRTKVADRFGIDVYTVVLLERGGVPKTTSGKVRRGACKEAYLAGRLPIVGISWHKQPVPGLDQGFVGLPDPEELAELDPHDRSAVLAMAVLHMAAARYEVNASTLRVADPVSALGLDSLAATELQHALEDRYGVRLPPLTMLSDFSFREVASRLWALRTATELGPDPNDAPTARPVAEVETGGDREGPLSESQRALWFEHESAPADRPAYVLARALRLGGPLDVPAFRRAVMRMKVRHPALRTRFAERDGEPIQVAAATPGPLSEEDVTTLDERQVAARLDELANRPFALVGEALFRVTLLRRSATEHLLVLAAHHAVFDFWSFCVLLRDVLRLYAEESGGEPAAWLPLRSSPIDHALAEPAAFGTQGDRLAGYWSQRLEGVPAALELPHDRPRPRTRGFRGALHRFTVDSEVTGRLGELARSRRSTLFAVLLTAYQALLWRYTGQRDFVVGTLTSGRDSAALSDVIGCFINPVPIRARFDDPAESFDTLLERTRHQLLQDLAHGDYPFGQLVGRVRPERAPGRPALIQTMLILQKEFGSEDEGMRAVALGVEGSLRSAGLAVESMPVPQRWAHLDLTVNLAEIGGALQGVVEYDTDLFDAETVADLVEHLTELLGAVAAEPGLPVRALPLLTAEERARALDAGGGRGCDRTAASLQRLVWEQARRTWDRVAVAGEGAAGRSVQLSYGGLMRWACWIEHRLRGLGVGAESRVGVLLERSAALPAALLGVLRTGAAYVPLDPQDPPARIAWLVADAGIATVVTTGELRGLLPDDLVDVVDVVEAAPSTDAIGSPAPAHPDQAAYVIYTSGSTGRPKGVVVPQRGIVNRLLWMQEELGLCADDRVLHKTPVTFDVSVWELFWPLLAGASMVLARPGGHRDASYLVDLVAREQVTTAHFVPSLLSPFLGAVAESAAKLPSLSRMVCSGETLPTRLCERFTTLLPARLYNLYGPTEASVDVTAWAYQPGAAVRIGTPITGVEVHVLDAVMQPLPPRIAGELYIGGVALACGYLGRPALTAAAFLPDPHSGREGARLYRTGDRARRWRDGSVEYLGRSDAQVKIAGNRIELGEVEEALRELPGVSDAAAAVRDDGGGNDLVAYVVGSEVLPESEVRAQLRQRLPGPMVPAVVVTLDTLPLTSSGKLDRNALPPPLTRPRSSMGPPPRPPRTATEHLLAALWAETLGVAEVGVDDDFFSLGGDSITAIRLVAKARAAGLPVTVSELVRHGTVRCLAEALPDTASDAADNATRRAGAPGEIGPFELCAPAARADFPAGVVDAYPISVAQQALLFQCLHNPAYEVYLTGLHLSGPFQATAMREAVARLMDRHPYLRSCFDLTRYHVPLQLVYRRLEPPLTVVDLRNLPVGARDEALSDWQRAERLRRFDLAKGPLARFCVHLRGEREFQLTVTSFALDGWCTATVLTELLRDYWALLHGEPPPTSPPRGGYPDFVALEQQALQSTEHRSFWSAELAEARPCLLHRRPVASPAGRREVRELQRRRTVAVDAEVAAGLRRLGRELSVPFKSVLLAAHLRVVSMLTAEPAVVTGLEVNGRPERLDGDRIVGVFNNVVPIRAELAGGTWAELVRAAFAAEAHILPYRRYPLARLEREHRVRRLFDTLFVYTHFHSYQRVAELDGLDLVEGEAPDQTYFPLTVHFNVDAGSGQLNLLLDYDSEELTEEFVDGVGRYYTRALELIAADPNRSYTADPLLTAEEMRRHLTTRSARPRGHPDGRADGLLHRAILRQATRTPDAVAVVDAEQQLSYAALVRRSGRLAAALLERGVGADRVIGVYGPRGVDLIVAILAVLRAGAAYLPLDWTLPRERVVRMLAAADAALLLAPAGTDISGHCQVLPWDTEAEPVTAPSPAGHPAQLAYAIFTSGSTGTPKVIGVPHEAVHNYLAWCVDAYALGQGGRVPAHSSISFDLTVTALLGPLVAGGTVHLLPDQGGPEAVGEALARLDGALLKITPAHLEAVGRQLTLAGTRPALRSVVVGGEQLRRGHLEPWWPLLSGTSIVNEYGPSEATVGCITYRVAEHDAADPVPIGRPIPGSRAYVLDEHALPVPTGVAAELHVGGICLSRGYLGRPALTAERFVPDSVGDERGTRLYRTGDIAHYDTAGLLHFVGRRDRQLKLRGHRVEPAEIELELGRHPGVREAIVAPRTTTAGKVRLVAYYVPAVPAPSARQLAGWLAERLPPPLVPADFVSLPELPRTRNGKVDHAALPDPTEARRAALVDAVRRLPEEDVRELLRQAKQGAQGRR